MAIVKQSSGHKRQWFDWLARLVCISAILTLTAAGLAGILGRRLDTLLIKQQAAKVADERQQDEILSAALKTAKAKWTQKREGLEKALQSAKLKIKATQTTNTKIRKQLVVLQKELAALKKSGDGQIAETMGSDKKAPIKAAAQATPIETKPLSPVMQETASAAGSPAVSTSSPAKADSLPGTVKPARAASVAVTPAPGDMVTDEAAAESVSKARVSQATSQVATSATTNSAKASSPPMTPPQSSLLAVPDADQVPSE